MCLVALCFVLLGMASLAEIVTSTPWEGKDANFDKEVMEVLTKNIITTPTHLAKADLADLDFSGVSKAAKKAFLKDVKDRCMPVRESAAGSADPLPNGLHALLWCECFRMWL